VGSVWVGAVVDCAVHVTSLPGGWQACGAKTPRAILILDGAALRAVDLDGAPMTEAALDRLCPGCAERMRAIAGATRGSA
jgi:hypothetical protein